MPKMLHRNPYPRPDANTVCTWEGYLYFVYEREAMRVARENNYSGVLTNDPILLKYRFTNIRRKHDRASQWVINKLIRPNSNRVDLWFTLLIARLVNWPPTLQALLDAEVIPCRPEDFDPVKFSAVLEQQKARGFKVYGAAYMVYPTMMNPGGVKSESIAKYIIGDAVLRADDIKKVLWGEKPNIENTVFVLTHCYGVSTFIAGQVAADLTYDCGHLGHAVDLYSYAPKGPGSQRGLSLLLARPINRVWKQSEFNSSLIQASELIKEKLHISGLTLHDVQNTMCEYSKYVKAVLGQGTPKSTYKTETGY